MNYAAENPQDLENRNPNAQCFSTAHRGGHRDRGSNRHRRQPRETIDFQLDQAGLYRKRVPRDESSLFRVVAEQVFRVQVYFPKVRAACVRYMERHEAQFKEFVKGDYTEYLERMKSDKTPGTIVEMKALSALYKYKFLVYHGNDQPDPEEIVAGDYMPENQVLLFHGGGHHYDSICEKAELTSAGIAQAIVYEVLYGTVFDLGEDIHSYSTLMLNPGAVEREKRERNENWEEPGEGTTEQRRLVDPVVEERYLKKGPPFPYKIVKSFQPHIYRNVAFDTWLENRKEMIRKNTGQVFPNIGIGASVKVNFPPEEAAKQCVVLNEKDPCIGWVQSLPDAVNDQPESAVVFIKKMGKEVTVPNTWLKPYDPPRPRSFSTCAPLDLDMAVAASGASSQSGSASWTSRRGRAARPPNIQIPPRGGPRGTVPRSSGRFQQSAARLASSAAPLATYPDNAQVFLPNGVQTLPVATYGGEVYYPFPAQSGIPGQFSYPPYITSVGSAGMPVSNNAAYVTPFNPPLAGTATQVVPYDAQATYSGTQMMSGFGGYSLVQVGQTPQGQPVMTYYQQPLPQQQPQPVSPSLPPIACMVLPYPEVLDQRVKYEEVLADGASGDRTPPMASDSDRETTKFFYGVGVRYTRCLHAGGWLNPRDVIQPGSVASQEADSSDNIHQGAAHYNPQSSFSGMPSDDAQRQAMPMPGHYGTLSPPDSEEAMQVLPTVAVERCTSVHVSPPVTPRPSPGLLAPPLSPQDVRECLSGSINARNDAYDQQVPSRSSERTVPLRPTQYFTQQGRNGQRGARPNQPPGRIGSTNGDQSSSRAVQQGYAQDFHRTTRERGGYRCGYRGFHNGPQQGRP